MRALNFIFSKMFERANPRILYYFWFGEDHHLSEPKDLVGPWRLERKLFASWNNFYVKRAVL